jgi:hypothetical protein
VLETKVWDEIGGVGWDKVEGLAERPMGAMTGSTKVTGTTGGRERTGGEARTKEGWGYRLSGLAGWLWQA